MVQSDDLVVWEVRAHVLDVGSLDDAPRADTSEQHVPIAGAVEREDERRHPSGLPSLA